MKYGPRLVAQAVRRLGRRLLGKRASSSMERGIVNLINVGSVGGPPQPWDKNIHRIGRRLSFDPREELSKDPLGGTMKTALWETNGERDFYVHKRFGGIGSSLFNVNYEYVEEHREELGIGRQENAFEAWSQGAELARVERIMCRRLDEVLQEADLPWAFQFMIIDAQGAEYSILKGAEAWLEQDCIGLHLELFVLPLYKGIVMLPDVVDYLSGFEFELVKKYPAHGSFDSQHDCVFLKTAIQGEVADAIRAVYGLPESPETSV